MFIAYTSLTHWSIPLCSLRYTKLAPRACVCSHFRKLYLGQIKEKDWQTLAPFCWINYSDTFFVPFVFGTNKRRFCTCWQLPLPLVKWGTLKVTSVCPPFIENLAKYWKYEDFFRVISKNWVHDLDFLFKLKWTWSEPGYFFQMASNLPLCFEKPWSFFKAFSSWGKRLWNKFIQLYLSFPRNSTLSNFITSLKIASKWINRCWKWIKLSVYCFRSGDVVNIVYVLTTLFLLSTNCWRDSISVTVGRLFSSMDCMSNDETSFFGKIFGKTWFYVLNRN